MREVGEEAIDWKDVRDRLGRLEKMASISVSQPEPPKFPPPETSVGRLTELPTPATDTDVEMTDVRPAPPPERDAKRSRARELLEDVLARVQSMEGMRQEFEERFEEFEDALYLGFGEKMDQIRKWDDPEQERDPRASLRSEEEGEDIDQWKGKEKGDVEAGWDDLERERDPEGRLRWNRPLVPEASAANLQVLQIVEAALKKDSNIKSLREEVAALKEDLATMREEKDKDHREAIEAVKEGLRGEYATIVKKVRLSHWTVHGPG